MCFNCCYRTDKNYDALHSKIIYLSSSKSCLLFSLDIHECHQHSLRNFVNYICWWISISSQLGACSQRDESRSESHFRTWLWLPFPDLKAWFYPLWMQISFKSGFWNGLLKCEKKGILDRDPCRKPDSRTCERKALSERDSSVCILEMCAGAMHGSSSADCAVGTKYYLAVRRSWSWLERHL